MDSDQRRRNGRDGISRRAFGTALGSAMAALGLRSTQARAQERSSNARGRESFADVESEEAAKGPKPFELDELPVTELQDGMQGGRFTSQYLVEKYISRIGELDKSGPALRAVLEINPDAVSIAQALDQERTTKGARGPLHGIPVLLKDNIATADQMQCTAGSLALVGAKPPRDAFLVQRLRDAGAVILGKTNLSEWANFRSTHSSSGWSGRGGQTRNPYALDRTPSGSSSGTGSAIAANFCSVGVGSETDGSITSPSSCASLVGLKPTVGLISRAGVVPISHSQDTAGPMCRTVSDVAALLGALVGVDARDPATAASKGKSLADYTKVLDRAGLKGARLGVVREHFTGNFPAVDKMTEEALVVLKTQGAVLVDPANLPNTGKYDDAELDVLLYEFKADLNAYLADLGPDAPVHSLAELIDYNDKHDDEEMPFFEQELFHQAEAKGPLTEKRYLDALARCRRLSRAQGIDTVMSKFKLDALIAPTQGPPWLIDLVNGDPGGAVAVTQPAAVSGYPHLTVPMGFVRGLPIGLSFFGRAWSEPTLLKLGFAFEQATRVRRNPTFSSSADL
jgi:amidase